MSELKTLKDFERSDFNEREEFSIGTIAGNNNLINELKAEAVKYYFDLKEHYKIDETTKEALIIQGAMCWIKHFFNLTEEDLKEVSE